MAQRAVRLSTVRLYMMQADTCMLGYWGHARILGPIDCSSNSAAVFQVSCSGLRLPRAPLPITPSYQIIAFNIYLEH